MPSTMNNDSQRTHAQLRRTRARWIVAALFLGSIPVMLAVSRWLPSLETFAFFVWSLAVIVFWFRSLNIGWPRRNFQVREPDPPRTQNKR